MSYPDTLARRVANALERRGALITLRRITTSSAPHLLPNPPTLISPMIDGTTLASVGLVNIKASEARGKLRAGDELRISSVIYRVTTDVASRALDAPTPGFDNVAITPTLRAAAPNGTPITPRWAADKIIRAIIQSYPRRLIDGEMILTRDMNVSIAAGGISEPLLTDKLIINGDVRVIISAVPAYAGAKIIRWDIQAR